MTPQEQTPVAGGSQRAQPVWVRSLTVCVAWLVGVTITLWFFNPISTVVLGVLAATIVSTTLQPLLRYMKGPRGVRAASLGFGFICVVAALLFSLSYPLARPIEREIKEWPQTQQHVDAFLAKWSTTFKLREPLSVQGGLATLGNFLAGEGGRSLFTRTAEFSMGLLLWIVFIFVGSIFILSEPEESLLGPIISMFPPSRRPLVAGMFGTLGPQLRRWVVGAALSMTIVFCASLTGYLSIGLQFAVPLALLGGLCEIVPTVGPATAAVIATLYAAATAGRAQVLGVLCVHVAIQSVEAYVILPMIMRGAVSIHPAVTLFTVVLWGKIFGVPGLMLAIPINLTLWALVRTFVIAPYHLAASPAPPAVLPQALVTAGESDKPASNAIVAA